MRSSWRVDGFITAAFLLPGWCSDAAAGIDSVRWKHTGAAAFDMTNLETCFLALSWFYRLEQTWHFQKRVKVLSSFIYPDVLDAAFSGALSSI